MKDTVVGTIASTICGAITGFALGYFAAATLPETGAPVLNVAFIATAFFAAVGTFVGAWISYVKDDNPSTLGTYAMIGSFSGLLVTGFLGWLLGLGFSPAVSLAAAILLFLPGALQGMAYYVAVKYCTGCSKQV